MEAQDTSTSKLCRCYNCILPFHSTVKVWGAWERQPLAHAHYVIIYMSPLTSGLQIFAHIFCKGCFSDSTHPLPDSRSDFTSWGQDYPHPPTADPLEAHRVVPPVHSS
eukprot:c36753_g1_i1 orf=664-987(-)